MACPPPEKTPGAAAPGDAAHAALVALGYLVLARKPGGGFRLVSPPGAPSGITPTPPRDLLELLENRPPSAATFVGSFLERAEEHWRNRSTVALRSGPWSESDPGGEELWYEGVAISTEAGPLLVFERLGARFEAERLLLQRVRLFRLAADQTIAELRRSAEELRDDRNELARLAGEKAAELESTRVELEAALADRLAAEQRAAHLRRHVGRLAQELAHSQESERRALATDLHDGVGQLLALTKIQLATLRWAATDADRERGFESLRELLDEIIRYTRTLTFELGSPGLEALPFDDAARSLAEAAARRGALQLTFRSDGAEKPLRPEARRIALQGLRELVTNAAKHSQAKHLEVHSTLQGAELRLIVADDGRGFSAGGTPEANRGGLGLQSLRARMESLGGRLETRNRPDHGAEVVLVVPCRGR